ncbi:MAG: hypothetical protein SZ59_C0005G0078 [candidate division TM6 bacterium GW2011_GWF2_28_16]|nr:MAG: hypothetical protein SZ59_C0005G0078 [candidate division TM6 bacterium GW2011_GWF2_28_16]
MKEKVGIFFLSLFLFNILNSTVIVTHGAWGDEMEWYRPGGYFHEALKVPAQTMGQTIQAFTWKQSLGGITHRERLNAAKDLAKLIVDLNNKGEKEIILIGHSYGGHVIKAASQLLAVALDFQTAQVPIISQDKNNLVSDKIANTQEWDQKYYEQVCTEVKEYNKLHPVSKSLNSDCLMDRVYTLGTPNDIPDYEANMKVVGCLFNFYSKGDLVQDLVGDHLLPEPKNDRAANLEVKIKGTGWFGLTNKPGHMKMHSEIIAKWILYIPFYLMTDKKTGFDKFNFERNGLVKFAENKTPTYSYTKSTMIDYLSWDYIKELLGIKV